MFPIEKIPDNSFNPNKEEEKPFISHIQKPKKKKREIKIMPYIKRLN